MTRFPACYDRCMDALLEAPNNDLTSKRETALEFLRSHESILVALSGGVDSAVLLALAKEALGADRVHAVTGRSFAVDENEVADAARVARQLGVRHDVVETHEIDRPEYRANAGDRCFHCRTELFEALSAIARRRGISVVAYGAIVDDLSDDRPGMVAAQQHGVIAPFLTARIAKTDVRTLANKYDLHVQDKPANPCLASRIPKGTEVTHQRLDQVRAAESALRTLGFRTFRVRYHEAIARLELHEDEISRLADPAIRRDVAAALRAAGFRHATVDLEGYRPGGADGQTESKLYSIAPQRDGGQ